MNITINLTISADCTPDTLDALLRVASQYHTATASEPSRDRGAPVERQHGPNVRAYMAEKEKQTGKPLVRFRKAEGLQGTDDETAAMIMLAQLNAGPQQASTPEPSADYADDSGEGWGE
jgi:hypothetical protein